MLVMRVLSVITIVAESGRHLADNKAIIHE